MRLVLYQANLIPKLVLLLGKLNFLLLRQFTDWHIENSLLSGVFLRACKAKLFFVRVECFLVFFERVDIQDIRKGPKKRVRVSLDEVKIGLDWSGVTYPELFQFETISQELSGCVLSRRWMAWEVAAVPIYSRYFTAYSCSITLMNSSLILIFSGRMF